MTMDARDLIHSAMLGAEVPVLVRVGLGEEGEIGTIKAGPDAFVRLAELLRATADHIDRLHAARQ